MACRSGSARRGRGHGRPAGPEKAKGIGAGAALVKASVTGHPTPTTYTFKGTGTDFFAHGTVKSTFTGTITLKPDGSAALAATGKYKGGTDAYKGATGKFTTTATGAPNSTVATFSTKGTLKY